MNSINGQVFRFNASKVLELIEHSESAPSQHVIWDDLFTPALWRDDATCNEHGYVDEDGVDPNKIAPRLLWVKDDGVYLMSAGLPLLELDPAHPDGNYAVYAKDFGPDVHIGGDDVSIPIQCLSFREALRAYDEKPVATKSRKAKSARTILIAISADGEHMSIDAD